MLFNPNCEYKLTLPGSPLGFPIDTLVSFSKGFCVGGDNCTIFVFEKAKDDLKNPYKLDRKITVDSPILFFL
jgi:hypothetical protein